MAKNKTERDVVDDLEELIRRELLDRLPLDTSGELAAMATADLLIVYLNWRGRYVAPTPRRVHMASELVASTGYAAHQGVVDELANRIAAGDDVTPQLSRGVAVAHIPQGAISRRATRRDLDRLIAEWGIHHLHLSLELESDGFSHRTGDLVFAAFQPADAYLIGVLPHGAWTSRTLAETCVRNWPSAGLFHASQGVVGLVHDVGEANHPALRAAGITTLLEIDGQVWAPPGQSMAGTPLIAAQHANVLINALRELRGIIGDLSGLTALVQTHGGDLTGRRPRVTASAKNGWFGLRDSQTGVFIPWVRVCG